ncbi:TIGR04282 family arsenosugar biosynthesis glycosyltransferase [Streptomyces hypolithicus]
MSTASIPAVLVMAKAPQPGRVKTRLHPLLGPRRCAELQRQLIQHTTALTKPQGLRTHVAFDSADTFREISELVPTEAQLLHQVGGDLGQRVADAVETVSGWGAGPLVAVGTDAPTLTGSHLAAAFGALEDGFDTVLGPALDGGYYLIGMRAPCTRLFGIDSGLWSGDQVLAATLAIAERENLSTHLLTPLRDLDTPDDAAAHLDDPRLPARIAALLHPEDAT